MQSDAQAARPGTHALSDRRQIPYRPGGVPGDPRLTRSLVELIEETRDRAGVSRTALLAAVGMSGHSWDTWRSGKHRVRPGKAQRILDRVRLVQSLDLDAIRSTPPGQRTARFLDAVNDARQRQERG